jgi:methyltransferase (TIGR00027 family)
MLTVADTAYAIAAVRAQEGDRPPGERLFTDPIAAIFCAAGAHAREGTERFLDLPFFRDAIRLRTRFVDDVVRDALAAGATQIILLGAGFDARPLRMAEITSRGDAVKVFEVDFEAQLAHKRALLEAAGFAPRASTELVPCDFGAPDFDGVLAADLAARGFRPDALAVCVWEGVVGYLDDAAIDRTLRLVARTAGTGSRLVFDVAAERFAPKSVEERVRRAGFAACETIGLDALWRRYALPGEPHENASLVKMTVATC